MSLPRGFPASPLQSGFSPILQTHARQLLPRSMFYFLPGPDEQLTFLVYFFRLVNVCLSQQNVTYEIRDFVSSAVLSPGPSTLSVT